MAPGTVRRLLLVLCLLASALQSAFFVYALVTDGDAEGAYLYHGYLAVTGQISLYQDEMTGHRVPLPYYVIGLSQVPWGPSLVAARAVSAGLGLGALVLVWLLAARLGGERCGILAALFAATQAYLLGYFAWATFHSLISFLLLVGLYVLLATDFPWRRVLAMGVCTLLFFTRPQIWPLHPLALAFLVREARSRGERWAIGAVAVGPPAVFFLSDVHHLKLLTQVPGLDRLVLPLGFQAVAVPYRAEHGLFALTGAAQLLARSYKGWIVAAAILLAVVAWRALRGRPVREFFKNRGVAIVAVVTAYLAAWQFAIIRFSPKVAIGYFPSFAMLAAIPLGYGFAVLLERLDAAPARRAAVGALLVAVFLVSPVASPPPALPLAVAYGRPAMVALQDQVTALRSLIPPGSRVFLFGPSETLFMAGLRPYLQQANHLETLSPVADDWIRRRSGQWGDAEIRGWLGRDAGYAVVRLAILREAREHQHTPSGNNVDLIESLLARHFRVVGVLDQYPGPPFYVYERTSSARPASSASRISHRMWPMRMWHSWIREVTVEGTQTQ